MEMTPQKETTEIRKLHPAIRSVWRFGAVFSGLIGGALCIVPSIVAAKLLHVPIWLGLLLGFLLGFVIGSSITLLFVSKQYEAWRFQLREHDLMIMKGIWWRSQRHIARDRIQHIDINSGPFDRRFGLVQIVVYAAGIAGSVGLIPGLKPDEAEWLKEQLLLSRVEEV